MKIYFMGIIFSGLLCVLTLSQCNQKTTDKEVVKITTAAADFNGFETQVKYGEHMVLIAGCHDCHSPKKMTDHGPELDTSLLLSGHPAQMPPPDVDPKEAAKGLVITNDLTSWVGPWGISFTANLTSDGTGIGNWSEEQFMYALRNGKYKGLAGSRDLLPPMPWQMYKNMTDDELKAIFAYLKTTKPIKNIVPMPIPPAMAKK